MPATTEFRLGDPAGITDVTTPPTFWLDARKENSADTRNSLT
jgi:hypothetical protein